MAAYVHISQHMKQRSKSTEQPDSPAMHSSGRRLILRTGTEAVTPERGPACRMCVQPSCCQVVSEAYLPKNAPVQEYNDMDIVYCRSSICCNLTT